MSCDCDVCKQSRRLAAIIKKYGMSKKDECFLLNLWELWVSAETDLEMKEYREGEKNEN